MANIDFRADAQDGDKALAAAAAVAEVQPDMLVGLGTGSTAAHAIRLLGARVKEGLSIEAVATSDASARLASDVGIAVRDFAEVGRVDLTIDGADRIDARLWAIKGAGGAMLREKIVAAASDRMVVIADAGKRVERLGGAPVPVEVLPFAAEFVRATLGPDAPLRTSNGKIHFTDSGNIILDWRVDLANPQDVATRLDALPGVLGHGLFLREVDAAYIAGGGIVTRLERGAQAD